MARAPRERPAPPARLPCRRSPCRSRRAALRASDGVAPAATTTSESASSRRPRREVGGERVGDVDDERVLAARHADVDLGEQAGVEQRAVQLAAALSTSKRLHSASSEFDLPGKLLARHRQAVGDANAVVRERGRPIRPARRREADVEGGVVDDDLGAAHELDQLVDDVLEQRLVGEELVRQAVHGDGTDGCGAPDRRRSGGSGRSGAD